MDINTRRRRRPLHLRCGCQQARGVGFTNVSRLNDETFDGSWQAATISFNPLSDLWLFSALKMVYGGVVFRWIARRSTSAFNYGLRDARLAHWQIAIQASYFRIQLSLRWGFH